jgi:hypothetical protein
MQTSNKQRDALVDAVTERLTEAGTRKGDQSQERLSLFAFPRSFESSDSHRGKGFSPQCGHSLSGTADISTGRPATWLGTARDVAHEATPE